MTSRRDELLQQLGITQWTLRRPTVLQGEIAVSLPPGTRLLIVANPLPASDDPLLQDVIHSLKLSPDETYGLTPQQVVMLPEHTRCHCWRLGIESPLHLEGIQLTSPALAELYHNAGAKRALWQQICQHEHNFSPAPD
ncbi:DNA polymerase III subunit psi [Pectobacteriaceae bacterium CE70]|uniref:DNA polymerase III subunit psi n=1 Tax=Serratia sp. (strain ATCC 39006) TaxID=104623 RepID=A0A2I5TPN2_SERS3|nr:MULTISPECIES: DNA polymerase III subunit psi [Enterobacterales]WJV63179.1 DNA polymerase III subunit psi [Pectobacteriaceae bacterium C52]WJV67549.1 DNA polymerase III subunit psi [Pectobacteriaceae bacterium CE70]WJY11489.1 DNA polymerase III subunit psi [Pectobacteriaceae bacterium C80]AUH02210.1 DNA polymerase III subunit psi [Serratia sp. ATCC 39006]AUH06531.1 DNA polymerase III subunit psi [Serratia sp. ATCC 39006]